MSYLDAATRAQLLGNPSSISALYDKLWHSFAIDLGALDANLSIGPALLPCAFATIIAWDLKRYGNEPAAVDLPTLLAAPTLACDDYVRLAWNLLGLIPQAVGPAAWSPARVIAIGVDHGAVGNHAQMMVCDETTQLLLDPTIGLVARIGFDDLFGGRGIPATNIASFERFNADELDSFRAEVRAALLHGSYRPSDLLYCVKSLPAYNAMPPESHWLTPAA